MATGFRFRGGSTKGLNPKKTSNNQDSISLEEVTINGVLFHIGFLSDGCTGERKTSRSETGSYLLTRFAISQVKVLLKIGTSLSDIGEILYRDCVEYCRRIITLTLNSPSMEEYNNFVSDYFLATLFGVIKSPTETLILASGDGVVAIDESVDILYMDNAALYLGYHLFGNDSLKLAGLDDKLPASFKEKIIKNDNYRHFAIASDGVIVQEEAQVSVPADFFQHCWNHKAHIKNGLQIYLASLQLNFECFLDDTSVIASNHFEI